MFRWFGHVGQVNATRVAGFAQHLREGRIMGSACTACGARAFPPRADCARCMSGEFKFVEIKGDGHLFTFTRIAAAPSGFERAVPYTLGVVDLEAGGRALAWFGDSITGDEIHIGMAVQLVPRVDEEREEIHVEYRIERPGATWTRAPRTTVLEGNAP